MSAQLSLDAAAEGMARALRNPEMTGWKLDAEIWLAELDVGARFTADDLVAACGKPDKGSPNVIGAWLNSKRRLGWIRWTGGYRHSKRPEGHGNLQRVWIRERIDTNGH